MSIKSIASLLGFLVIGLLIFLKMYINDYISKPVKPKILLKKITSIIKRINAVNKDEDS